MLCVPIDVSIKRSVKLFIVATVVFLLAVVACAPSSRLSRSWYKQKPPLVLADTTLKGKVIMLDPGHGNRTSGSIGLYGTKERDVNLAVALNLKKLLEIHGATVIMTRESDTTVFWPSNISAREDLGFRCRFRDSLQPDLFISLHHNGSEDGSRNVNSAKTFYALGDDGGSLDLASCINNEFTKQLGLGVAALQKGNYYVLRNPVVPSVIGEPSYLSHPGMEKILGDSAAIYLEAVAYFKGIESWFSKSVPQITDLFVEPVHRNISATIQSENPLDSMLTYIMCDEKKLTGRLTSTGFSAALPFPLKNGGHTIACFAGNVTGNLATKKSTKFTIDRQPASLQCSYATASAGPIVPIHITVLDSLGLLVKDGTAVTINGKSTCIITDGNALYYHYINSECDTVHFSSGSVSRSVIVNHRSNGIKPFQGFIKSTGNNRIRVQCVLKIGENIFASDRNGFFSFYNEENITREIGVTISGKGFIDTTLIIKRGLIDTIHLSPRASGILFGKKIMIDPEFGGYEEGGVSSSGIRACDITRKVSTCMASQLELYGAEVLMARSEDQTIHVTERVFSAQKNSVDFYILVRSDSVKNDPYIMYSPGSEKGQMAAESFKKYWNKESKLPVKVFPKVEYVLQQTECPAIGISLCPVSLLESTDPQMWRIITRTVVGGLIDYYSNLGSSMH